MFFIFGAGFSARAFARQSNASVYGTTRTSANFHRLERAGIHPLIFDGDVCDKAVTSLLADVTHLLVSIAPDAQGDPVLRRRHLLETMPNLRWIGYFSTVGVYGDHQGAEVDETADCRPSLARNRMRLEAENGWKQFAASRHVPLLVMRLAGIYGPGRNAFLKLRDGTAHRIIKPGQVFSRIHSDDIGAAVSHLAAIEYDGIVNLADDEPAPPQDIVTYAAALMGMEPPPEIPFEKAELSVMARSFYQDSKYISNAHLKQTGYRMKWPDYRLALDNLWRSGCWMDEGFTPHVPATGKIF